MFRKYLTFLMLAVFVFSNCAYLTQSLAILNCDYTLMDVRAANIGLTAMDLVISIQVRNPNSIDVHIANLSFDLLVNDKKVLDGVYSHKTVVPAGQAVIVEQITKLNYFESTSVAFDLIRGGNANYRVVGTVLVETPFGTMPFEIDIIKGRI
jgi:LEA14-like dessication related protein